MISPSRFLLFNLFWISRIVVEGEAETITSLNKERKSSVIIQECLGKIQTLVQHEDVVAILDLFTASEMLAPLQVIFYCTCCLLAVSV